LVNLGFDNDARLCLDELEAKFVYKPGTSVLFSGAVFSHSVPQCAEEGVVLAHYSNKNVQDRLGVARPDMPTQHNWYRQMQ
jgi:hypothetical protein